MLGIGLSGCTVGPDYRSPEIKEARRQSTTDDGSVPSRTVEAAVNLADVFRKGMIIPNQLNRGSGLGDSITPLLCVSAALCVSA